MRRNLIAVVAVFLATGLVCAQDRSARSTKPVPSPVDCSTTTDAQITSNVKSKLASTPSLKDQAIEVATAGGVVTLTGRVKTSSSKGAATRSAKAVDCVKKVVNNCEAEIKTVPPKAKNKTAKP